MVFFSSFVFLRMCPFSIPPISSSYGPYIQFTLNPLGVIETHKHKGMKSRHKFDPREYNPNGKSCREQLRASRSSSLPPQPAPRPAFYRLPLTAKTSGKISMSLLTFLTLPFLIGHYSLSHTATSHVKITKHPQIPFPHLSGVHHLEVPQVPDEVIFS